MPLRSAARAALVLFLLATPAAAQPAAAVHWLEVGAGASGLLVLPGGVGGMPALQARFNITPTAALDVVADFMRSTRGLYRLQARFARPAAGRTRTFFTVGLIGEFRLRQRFEGYRRELPTGDVVVQPSYRYSGLMRPLGVSAGIGLRAAVAPRIAVEVSPQCWLVEGFAAVLTTTAVVALGPGR